MRRGLTGRRAPLTVPALLALLAMPSRAAPGRVLFEDGFSEPLERNWILFGDPLPVRRDSIGLPPPCFDNNGGTMYDSGALSRESWDYSQGLVLECDMFVTSNQRGAWIAGCLSFVLQDSISYGPDGLDHYFIRLSYNYCGEANWSCPHLQGQMIATMFLPDGTREQKEYLHFNEYLDGWHRFRIAIDRDMFVSFFVDSLLLYRTEHTVPEGLGGLSIVIGNRSNHWGRVYHDNLVLRTADSR